MDISFVETREGKVMTQTKVLNYQHLRFDICGMQVHQKNQRIEKRQRHLADTQLNVRKQISSQKLLALYSTLQ